MGKKLWNVPLSANAALMPHKFTGFPPSHTSTADGRKELQRPFLSKRGRENFAPASSVDDLPRTAQPPRRPEHIGRRGNSVSTASVQCHSKRTLKIRQPRKYPDSETRATGILTRHKTDPQDALDVINGLAFAIL